VTRLRNNQQLWDREDMKCCPIDTTFRLVGKKFTILIIREMMRDKTRFNQILDFHRRNKSKDTFCKIKGNGKERVNKKKSIFY